MGGRKQPSKSNCRRIILRCPKRRLAMGGDMPGMWDAIKACDNRRRSKKIKTSRSHHSPATEADE